MVYQFFYTNLFLNIFDEYDKIDIHSPSIDQNLYKTIIKSFTNYIPIHIIPNNLNEQDIDVVIDELCNDTDFQKSHTEIETYESIEELKFFQDNVDGGSIILDDFNEKEVIAPRVQATFKRSRRNSSSLFLISQDYYELPKRSIRANGNIYHIFKLNNLRDVQNLYQDKASMDMTFKEVNYLTSTWWIEKYQPLL